MKITLSKRQWEQIGEKSGWIKISQVQAQPTQPTPPAQAPAQQPAAAPTRFSDVVKRYPEIGKYYETIRTTKPMLTKLLAQYNINWQSIPEFLEILG